MASRSRVDIEAQMTMFAYYYIGIGLGVLILSYFQVCVSRMDPPKGNTMMRFRFKIER